MSTQFELPRKQREMMNHHMDSTVWNDFQFRDGDIVIGTWGKSGTTWLQQIIGQMIFGGSDEINIGEMSPWVDLRVPPKPEKLAMLEAQTHRRFLKTHLAGPNMSTSDATDAMCCGVCITTTPRPMTFGTKR